MIFPKAADLPKGSEHIGFSRTESRPGCSTAVAFPPRELNGRNAEAAASRCNDHVNGAAIEIVQGMIGLKPRRRTGIPSVLPALSRRPRLQPFADRGRQ
jgi:hypothetical protein